MPSPLLTLKLTYTLGRLVLDPSRLELVFGLSDALLKDPAATADFGATLAQPQAARACQARFRTPVLDLARLEAAAEGTLARRAAAFFRANQLDPGALPRRDPTTDAEWLSAHLYETHDLWHVVTGFAPDVAGELGLQAFYATQVTGMFAHAILAAGLTNTVFFKPGERDVRLDAIVHGYQMGKNAKPFVGLDWAALLDLPFDEVRRRLGLTPAARGARKAA